MTKVTGLYLQIQSGTTSTLFASWDFSKTNTDRYRVDWHYATGDGVWFSGGGSDVEDKNATYNIPSNATSVRVTVKPLATTYESNGYWIPHWQGVPTSAEFTISTGVPIQPSAPTVALDKFTLTSTLVDITDKNTDEIEFEVVKENLKHTSGIVSVVTQRAIFSCTLAVGYKYRVRCRAINLTDGRRVYGEWSSYSNEISTMPSEISRLTANVDSKTSIKLTWTGSSTADSYEVQYATNRLYFDTSSEVRTTTVTATTAFITGLESGREWFFRVRATNNQGQSGWSTIISKIIGTIPKAPTTWTMTSTAIAGNDITLYWVHNSEDGSKMAAAQIRLIANGVTSIIDYTNNSTDDDNNERKIYTYALTSTIYTPGAEILWSIRTKGVTDDYGDWSIQRTITLYAPPTLTLNLNTTASTRTLTALPLIIEATAGPTTQTPTSYHVLITNISTYEIEDVTGQTKLVNSGSEVYSRVFNVSNNPLVIKLSAGDVSFQNGQEYKIVVTASMDSGLTAIAWDIFRVSWTDFLYEPNAKIVIDSKALAAYISPFCLDMQDGLIDNVTLAIYRREYNGSFTEIASGLTNNGITTVTDPHPALDYARYRIVAQSISTGQVGYEDLPGIPIKEPSIVIQWDESWSEFDHTEEKPFVIPPWSGSMLRLKYNVDISESHDKDYSLIEYIGRKYPVSYYGTQLRESSTWSTEIPKTDKETIYTLRRLAAWAGNVYVREPSGNGYWARVSVSISSNHSELTTKASFDINRVEGGL